ncbi:MAG: copper chaperone PCu(A)C [Proteobacteria bacterium]|nr:copper chaperone PCu(A)C [Pseudomonadota bacterium]
MTAVSVFLAACSPPAVEQTLTFEDAWVRATPPGAMNTAGYGRLVNHTDLKLEITAFTSPDYADVSLHETVIENDVSRMREVPGLSIPPGGEVELAPGGYHLMLMMPTQAAGPHDRVVLQIEEAGGQRFSFELPVERR